MRPRANTDARGSASGVVLDGVGSKAGEAFVASGIRLL